MDASQSNPRCNIAAVALQAVAMLAGYLALVVTSKPESLIGLLYAVPTYALFSFFGVVVATIASIRRERWVTLTWIAFFVNFIPFLSMVCIIGEKVNFW